METNTLDFIRRPGFLAEPGLANVQTFHHTGKQRIISGWTKEIIELLIRAEVLLLVLWYFRNPLKWRSILQAVDPHRQNVLGARRITKIARVNGKYYWGLFIPGWPSSVFHQFVKGEINRVAALPGKTNRFNNIFMAVTNKCPLACEHCYEWDALNRGERLTLSDLKSIVAKIQEMGVSQIHLSGGEPLVRMNDVIEVVKYAAKESECWMLTSGFRLTGEKALALKQSGLTGVIISLDHVDPEIHNAFRGHKGSFHWVEEAVRNAISAKLVTALSVCGTKAFVSESNLMNYMEYAKNLGVSFVQFLEPRAAGHYKGQDVGLTGEQEQMLEDCYLRFNYDDQYKAYPPISYHGYHQRRMGCLAAGDRSLYLDTTGDIHACPFCQRVAGNVLKDDVELAILRLRDVGCHRFRVN